MDESLQELKLILRELILEVGELKERVNRLEIETGQKEPPIPLPAYSLELEGESYQNLGRIYQQGYHICPTAFGQVRYEECLFCIALLEKE
jgi:regulator of replication initiation timing